MTSRTEQLTVRDLVRGLRDELDAMVRLLEETQSDVMSAMARELIAAADDFLGATATPRSAGGMRATRDDGAPHPSMADDWAADDGTPRRD